MIDQVQLKVVTDVLVGQGVLSAVIIDDAYDLQPTPYDISEEAWDFFVEDVKPVDEALIDGRFAGRAATMAAQTSRNDAELVAFLWENRGASQAFKDLFATFVERQAASRALLAPLEAMLSEMGLTATTIGALADVTAAADAQLIFLDLFLNARQDLAARELAVDRILRVVGNRRADPPLVVLISSSIHLQGLAEWCRGKASLMGCQFRALPKEEIMVPEALLECIYQLGSRYLDTLRLSRFMVAWQLGLKDAAASFVAKISRLDLRDYADIQQLVLASQNEAVGTYLLQAYDQFFHHELEGDLSLVAAGREIDAIDWTNYPPSHFLPDPVAGEIVDGLMFHNALAVAAGDPFQFGDLLFGAAGHWWPEGGPRPEGFSQEDRVAMVLLTQSCDIQQCNAKRLFFMTGIARKSALLLHKRPEVSLTPTVLVDRLPFVVTWDAAAPLTLDADPLAAAIGAGLLSRVRRFRPLYALQLQQHFVGQLSRVGTPVMLPQRHVVALRIGWVRTDSTFQTLLVARLEEREGVTLVGRDRDGVIDQLILSRNLVQQLVVACRSIDVAQIAEKTRGAWTRAVASRQFFRRFEDGVPYERARSSRPMRGTDFDAVLIVGPYMVKDRPVGAEGRVASTAGPLIIEVSVAPDVS